MKIKEVFKKGIAGFMTAAMLLGNYSPVLAADDVNTEVVSISEDEIISGDEAVSGNEAVSEDAVSEDESVSENDTVSEDEAMAEEETGTDETEPVETNTEDAEGEEVSDVAGTEEKPEKLEFGKEVTVTLAKGAALQYYEFTTQNKGYLEIYALGTKTHPLNINIFENEALLPNKVFAGEAAEKKSLAGRVGLKAGAKYILCAQMTMLTASEGEVTGAFQVDFKESDFWEEELDSETSYKTIDTNTKYYGTLNYKAMNYIDYYAFDVTKAGTVKIYEKGCFGAHVTLCSDDSFDTDNAIANVYTDSNGKVVINKKLAVGKYYLMIRGVNDEEYEFKVTVPGGSSKPAKEKYPATGILTMNGKEYKSLQEAVANMTEAIDYEIDLKSDLVGEKPIKLPKNVKSVKIRGFDHSIVMKGSKITAKCPLSLEGVTIKAVNAKKEGVSSKLNISAKKGLAIWAEVKFDAVSTKISVKEGLTLMDRLSANSVTTDNLTMMPDALYVMGAGNKLTVKKELKAESGAEIFLNKGFKPISLKGSASGKVTFSSEENLPDGTQVLNCSAKKISADNLKEVFDCADLTANKTKTYLYYLSGSKACIFGEAIEFNGNKYGLWKDVVADMNAAVKEAKKSKTAVNFEVSLKGNVNMAGKFTLPKKGYESLTIKGNGHSLTFTSDITLTGNLNVSDDTTLIKVNKKNEKVAGKIKAGKFTYNGPQITQ